MIKITLIMFVFLERYLISLHLYSSESTVNQNVIILTDGESFETWGSIAELCRVKRGFKYSYLKNKTFPFEYKGVRFVKAPFRAENGISPLTGIHKSKSQ